MSWHSIEVYLIELNIVLDVVVVTKINFVVVLNVALLIAKTEKNQ